MIICLAGLLLIYTLIESGVLIFVIFFLISYLEAMLTLGNVPAGLAVLFSSLAAGGHHLLLPKLLSFVHGSSHGSAIRYCCLPMISAKRDAR